MGWTPPIALIYSNKIYIKELLMFNNGKVSKLIYKNSLLCNNKTNFYNLPNSAALK